MGRRKEQTRVGFWFVQRLAVVLRLVVEAGFEVAIAAATTGSMERER